jgi:hypothetical protein
MSLPTKVDEALDITTTCLATGDRISLSDGSVMHAVKESLKGLLFGSQV